jgi:hypothetical protein
MAVDWDDNVLVQRNDGTLHTEINGTVLELDNCLRDRAESRKLNRFDQTFDLTELDALEIAVLTLPACEVKYAAAIVRELVVAGGTTVKLGIGPTGTKNKYGNLATLVVGAHVETVFSTVLTSTEDVLLSAVATNGTSAGDTNISAGSVRIVIEYYTANALV